MSFNEDEFGTPKSHQRSFNVSDLALSKLENKLKSQQGLSTLNLSDGFIGDEGCAAVSEFLKNNPQIQCIELRGNNITPTGLRALGAAFRYLPGLKVLTLEWNSLESGVGILLDALLYSSSIKVLDLRNNKIGPDSGPSLGKFIENNPSVERIDLRWNELGTGAVRVLSALRAPHSLQSLELAGNRIPEDILVEIEGLIETGPRYASPQSPRYRSPVHSPPRYKSPLSKSTSQAINPLEDDTLYARYESTMLDNARLEARVNEIELLLDQESKRSAELREDLFRDFESEKSRRLALEDALSCLKEEAFKREMEDSKFRQDLETRISQLNKEKSQLLIENDYKQEQMDNSEKSSHGHIRALEDKLVQSQRQFRQLEDSSKQTLECDREELISHMDEMKRELLFKLETAEDTINTLRSSKEAAEQENKALRTQTAKLKTMHEEQLGSQEYSIRQEESEKFHSTMGNFEGRLREVEETRDSLNRKTQELQREKAALQQTHLEQFAELDNNFACCKEENSELQGQLQHSNSTLEGLKGEHRALEHSLDKLKFENGELKGVIQQKSHAHMQKLEGLYSEQAAERQDAENTKGHLTAKFEELTQEFDKVLRERDRVLQEHEGLCEVLKARAVTMLQDSFSHHVKTLELSLNEF